MDVTSHFSSAVPQVVTHVGVGVAVGSGVGVIAGELLGAKPYWMGQPHFFVV